MDVQLALLAVTPMSVIINVSRRTSSVGSVALALMTIMMRLIGAVNPIIFLEPVECVVLKLRANGIYYLACASSKLVIPY